MVEQLEADNEKRKERDPYVEELRRTYEMSTEEYIVYMKAKYRARETGEDSSGTIRPHSPPPPPLFKVNKARREQSKVDEALAKEIVKETTKGLSQEGILKKIERKKKEEEEVSRKIIEDLSKEEEAEGSTPQGSKRRKLVKAVHKKQGSERPPADLSSPITRSRTGILPRSRRFATRIAPVRKIPPGYISSSKKELECPLLEILNDIRLSKGERPIKKLPPTSVALPPSSSSDSEFEYVESL